MNLTIGAPVPRGAVHMSISIPSRGRSEFVYPESDGKPMAENTLQFQWIVTIKEGLARAFAARPDIFVAGDLLWYPVEGRPDICAAPDAMVAIGRPQGYRGCYKQWEEEGIGPQVVFEVLSPNNRFGEMFRKLEVLRNSTVWTNTISTTRTTFCWMAGGALATSSSKSRN